MSVAERDLQCPEPDAARVRELLQRCGRTRDRAERAALLTRVASELDGTATEIAGDGTWPGCGELAAGLRGQASMARFVADLERHDRAREAAGSG